MNLIRKFVVSPQSSMPIVVNNLRKKNIIPIFDYAIENTGTNNSSLVKFEMEKIIRIHFGNFVALKLSAFDLSRSEDNIVSDCCDIIKICNTSNTDVTIDAEQVSIQDKISALTDTITHMHGTKVSVYKTYQMYRKDSLYSLNRDLNMYDKLGITLNPKLVRGAYLVQDRKTGALCDKLEDTHKNYNNGLQLIVDNMKTNKNMKLIAATHNENSMDILKNVIDNENRDRIYFAHLLGFSDKTSYKLAEDGYKVMKYVPFGPITKTYPYLIRRLIENYELTRFI